jgi:MYXO-CTERM domain-containing protein
VHTAIIGCVVTVHPIPPDAGVAPTPDAGTPGTPDAGTPIGEKSGGCGCSVGGREDHSSSRALLLIGLFGLGAVVVRRRR